MIGILFLTRGMIALHTKNRSSRSRTPYADQHQQLIWLKLPLLWRNNPSQRLLLTKKTPPHPHCLPLRSGHEFGEESCPRVWQECQTVSVFLGIYKRIPLTLACSSIEITCLVTLSNVFCRVVGTTPGRRHVKLVPT